MPRIAEFVIYLYVRDFIFFFWWLDWLWSERLYLYSSIIYFYLICLDLKILIAFIVNLIEIFHFHLGWLHKIRCFYNTIYFLYITYETRLFISFYFHFYRMIELLASSKKHFLALLFPILWLTWYSTWTVVAKIRHESL